jgi:hypothetical protein
MITPRQRTATAVLATATLGWLPAPRHSERLSPLGDSTTHHQSQGVYTSLQACQLKAFITQYQRLGTKYSRNSIKLSLFI